VKVGELVHDWAYGKNGIVVDGANVEVGDGSVHAHGEMIEWEWLVLYEDGELQGAGTRDITVMENESR
jgi:hypothetical protein